MALNKFVNFLIFSVIILFGTVFSAVFHLNVGTRSAKGGGFGDTLKIATVQFTSEWNPISHSTFPASLVTALTTERLFEPVCIGQSVGAEDAYMPVCQDPAAQIGRGGVNINIVGCRGNGRQLHADDIQYTLDQISRVMHNDHNLYDLKIQKNRLLIKGGAADWYVRHAFSFPIVRRGPEKLFLMRILAGKVGDKLIDVYNDVTSGDYRLDEVHSDSVKIISRKYTNSGRRPIIENIQLLIYDRMSDLSRDMVQDNPPHVVLSMGRTTTKSLYRKRHSPDLRSFTYIGFNYKTDDKEKRKLFIDKTFRELFTLSLWSIEEIRNFVKAPGVGIFLGESFDSGHHIRDIDKPSSGNIDKINDYLKKRSWSGTLNMKIIVPPDVGEIFDEADLKNIALALNDRWQTEVEDRNINFTITPSVTPAIFDKLKKRRQYDLVMDTLYFGKNPLKYMAFLHPDSQINELEFNGIPADEIDNYMQEMDIQGFLDRVRDTYPVAVIGRIDRRHFFLKELKTSVPPDPPCGAGTIVMPFYDLKMWSISPTQ